MGDFNDPFMRNPNQAVQARAKAQNRANVMQLKLIGQSHPTGLTTNLLKLFEPRPPLEFKPPPEKRKCPQYTGMAQFVRKFAQPGDPEYAPPVQKGETPAQRKARIHQLRLEEGAKKVAEELKKYDPNNDHNISGDPYKTLFVARLNYETTESRVKREFETYGPIKRVRLITDKNTSKPRGYAFIEYVHTRDMKNAYKQADGKKIDNRRVLVDVERGRTVPNWRPRRLGGGLGTTRVGGDEINLRNAGREQPQSGVVSRSEEPRVRDDREREREKSRERTRDKERDREKSRERSQDRPRDRDHREDRHHRDREKTRDREREKDRGRDRDRDRERTRDRDRGQDRTRDYEPDREKSRDRDRGHDRHREREKDKGQEYAIGDADHERGRSRDREHDYDKVDVKRERDRRGDREAYDDMDKEESHGWGEQSDRGSKHLEDEKEHDDYDYYEHYQGKGHYEKEAAAEDDDGYKNSHRYHDQYDQMDEDKYGYDHAASAPKEEKEYRHPDRMRSREYEY